MPSAAPGPVERINRFERARIIGARALQISAGAPILIPVTQAEAVDPISVAEREFAEGVIPITVLRQGASLMKG